MPYDHPDWSNREYFSTIVDDMDKGGEGDGCNLMRTNEYGIQEEYCYVYLPVYIRELNPVQPDDYTRGVDYSKEFLYSMIMLERKENLLSEFNERRDDIKRKLDRSFIVYIFTTIFVTLICIVVTATVSCEILI